MNRLYELCPLLKTMTPEARYEAIVRMARAYVLNGGHPAADNIATAIKYLESLA